MNLYDIADERTNAETDLRDMAKATLRLPVKIAQAYWYFELMQTGG
jgi:hypothetical protein